MNPILDALLKIVVNVFYDLFVHVVYHTAYMKGFGMIGGSIKTALLRKFTETMREPVEQFFSSSGSRENCFSLRRMWSKNGIAFKEKKKRKN